MHMFPLHKHFCSPCRPDKELVKNYSYYLINSKTANKYLWNAHYMENTGPNTDLFFLFYIPKVVDKSEFS